MGQTVRTRLLRESTLKEMVLEQYLKEQVEFRLTKWKGGIPGKGNSHSND